MLFFSALSLALLLVAGQPGRWTYETVKRAGQNAHKASVPAAEPVFFDYPYGGGSVVTLVIRQGPDEPAVALETQKGLFTRSFQNGSARLRFDGGKPVTFPLLAAANGRANIIFFDNATQLVRRLKTSGQVQISLHFAGQRPRQVRFVTTGLRWPP